MGNMRKIFLNFGEGGILFINSYDKIIWYVSIFSLSVHCYDRAKVVGLVPFLFSFRLMRMNPYF